MARVCVGCGLTTDSGGVLITNTPASWPFSCDQEDEGADVYCSPVDGALRIAPPTLATTYQNEGSAGTNTITDGNTELVDLIEYTLTNPSPCHSAQVFMTAEADPHIVLNDGESYRVDIAGDQYMRFSNFSGTTMDTVRWQLARSEVFTLTPGQVLVANWGIAITAQGGDVVMDEVSWRVHALIVAT